MTQRMAMTLLRRPPASGSRSCTGCTSRASRASRLAVLGLVAMAALAACSSPVRLATPDEIHQAASAPPSPAPSGGRANAAPNPAASASPGATAPSPPAPTATGSLAQLQAEYHALIAF